MKVMGGFQSEWFRQRNMKAQQNGIMSGLPTLDTTTTKPSVGGAYNSWTTAGFFWPYQLRLCRPLPLRG